ncbi:AraC family transcriptional regulator [uncultured Aquimarina sp.]|uniref:AraC family transcriptional regulator n=1 Tax=uncultured Aquimarina sp. TaxID=575652 RepID=UPI002613EF14|nr:AraC family transcriptional regulator [uncultured Aquimarina sp.]
MNSNHFRIETDIDYIDSRDRIFRMVFVDSGNATFKIDFSTYDITGPTLVFISENQLLSIQKKSVEFSWRTVCFSNDFFCIKLNRSETFCDAVIFNTTKPPYIPLQDTELKKVDYLITAMNNELEEANDFQEEIIISQLKTLLLYSSKIKLKQFGEVNLSVLSPVVTDFQNLLDTAYERQHTVQFYADELNISPKGLNKAVKKELGRTVSELIKEKLIVEAKRELYTKELSIKEIGYKLGFEDPAYFSRFFRKETSHSPKEYAELL